MRRALARMGLVTLTVLALYAAALFGLAFVPGVNIVMPFPIYWTGAFCVAVVFAAWNLYDDVFDVRGAYRRGLPARYLVGGQWRMRSDALQGAACSAMGGAGALAVVQWGGIEMRTALIVAAAGALVANQVWNRIDRERILSLPAAASEVRAMERIAEELAADARKMGHAFSNKAVLPFAVLEEIASDPTLPLEIRARAAEALTAMEEMMAMVRNLHAEVKLLEPKL